MSRSETRIAMLVYLENWLRRFYKKQAKQHDIEFVVSRMNAILLANEQPPNMDEVINVTFGISYHIIQSSTDTFSAPIWQDASR